MKKIRPITLVAAILVFGCKAEMVDKSYRMIVFQQDNLSLRAYNMIDTVKFSYLTKGSDTTEYHYLFSEGRRSYYFLQGGKTGFISTQPRDTFLHGIDTAYRIRCFADTLVRLGERSLHLQKYILNEDIQDGATIHYFCDSIGVYAIHSDTWPGIMIVQSNDRDLNSTVLKLVRMQVPSIFIRSPLKELINE